MKRKSHQRTPDEAPRDTPVKPGTPLYRLLEMIAVAIVKDEIGDGPPDGPVQAAEKT